MEATHAPTPADVRTSRDVDAASGNARDRTTDHTASRTSGRTSGCTSGQFTQPLVVAHDVTRRWGKGAGAQLGLDRVDLTIGHGELVAVVGPSGSGKSTLGALIAGIDRPTSGSLVVDGHRIDQMSNDQLARWRGDTVGIVFQDFHLLPTLTAAENVALALDLTQRRVGRRERRRRSAEALTMVGLAQKTSRLPHQLSGGEQQRVAIARAIVARPRLIVADEPTGSLDQASGTVVVDLLTRISGNGATVVFITHDEHLAARAHRTVEMLDGRVVGTHAVAGVTNANINADASADVSPDASQGANTHARPGTRPVDVVSSNPVGNGADHHLIGAGR